QEYTAAHVINEATEQELIEIFKTLGEIRSPFRVVRAIVNDRKITPYKTTRELASLIERVEGWRKKGFHPATQFFMALRLKVNGELEHLTYALPELMKKLKIGGRMGVISFHSLEDRIVKNIFKDSDLGKPIHKRVIIGSDEEIKTNPRARSAKLRVFERRVQDELEGYRTR
ncbi:MAG: 16S rRNA (cytosine(1402)-N(4))-methyltransferase, partial [Bdellovibrionota bacterium]